MFRRPKKGGIPHSKQRVLYHKCRYIRRNGLEFSIPTTKTAKYPTPQKSEVRFACLFTSISSEF